jgi:hypothetical protein
VIDDDNLEAGSRQPIANKILSEFADYCCMSGTFADRNHDIRSRRLRLVRVCRMMLSQVTTLA